jgi:hypothetical protein
MKMKWNFVEHKETFKAGTKVEMEQRFFRNCRPPA